MPTWRLRETLRRRKETIKPFFDLSFAPPLSREREREQASERRVFLKRSFAVFLCLSSFEQSAERTKDT